MNGWIKFEIPKRQSLCARCQNLLKEGMEIYSLLVEEEESKSFQRKDFCLDCWSNDCLNQKDKMKGYWKSHLQIKTTEEKNTKIDRACTLLQERLQAPEEKEEEIFILTLFLAHARHLILRQEFKEKDVLYHLYEWRYEENFLTVKVPSLSSMDIEALQQTLAKEFTA